MQHSFDLTPLHKSRDALAKRLDGVREKMVRHLEARDGNLHDVIARPDINALLKRQAEDALKVLDAVDSLYLSLDRNFVLKEQRALKQLEEALSQRRSDPALADARTGLNLLTLRVSMDIRQTLAKQYLGLIDKGSIANWRDVGGVVADVAVDEAVKWSGKDSIENAVKVVQVILGAVDALEADLKAMDDVSKWLNALHDSWQRIQNWLAHLEKAIAAMTAEEEQWRQVSAALEQIGRDS